MLILMRGDERIGIDTRNELLRETLRQLELLRESPSEETMRAVERWISESPLHAASFVRQVAIERGIRDYSRRRTLREVDTCIDRREAESDDEDDRE